LQEWAASGNDPQLRPHVSVASFAGTRSGFLIPDASHSLSEACPRTIHQIATNTRLRQFSVRHATICSPRVHVSRTDEHVAAAARYANARPPLPIIGTDGGCHHSRGKCRMTGRRSGNVGSKTRSIHLGRCDPLSRTSFGAMAMALGQAPIQQHLNSRKTHSSRVLGQRLVQILGLRSSLTIVRLR
jgi:hypothetical protein